MKKEMAAAALLLSILALSLFHTRRLEYFTNELADLTRQVEAAAREGDWDAAWQLADRIAILWRSQDGYTQVVLKHSDLDAVEDAIFRLLESAAEHRAPAALVHARLVREHLEAIMEMEKLRPGSIL